MELPASLCSLLGAALLSVPAPVSASPHAFSLSLAAFFLDRCTSGVHMPCEGPVCSFYLWKDSVCSVTTRLWVVVNTAMAARGVHHPLSGERHRLWDTERRCGGGGRTAADVGGESGLGRYWETARGDGGKQREARGEK